MKAREINQTVRYTMWSVFRRTDNQQVPAEDAFDAIDAIGQAQPDADLVVRGWYDLAGLRADADVMVWWHASDSDALQDAYLALRRSALGRRLVPVWSQAAVHRPAEFNKAHVPAYMSDRADDQPKGFVSVYPYVRSYEWYLLPDEERKQMLAEHGILARQFPDVRSNTVASFALGDYEWMLAFEADELHRLVDLMRELRKAEARRHTRLEIPFYTGRRRDLVDIVSSW